MPSAVFVVPGAIATRSGGSIYDRRMADGLRRRGWEIAVVELAGDFPRPNVAAVTGAAEALAALPDGTLVVMDGLALSALPDLIEREAARLRVVALVHLPLAADVSIAAESRARLAVAEHRALAASALIVVTGAATLGLLDPYALPRDRVVVVEPGTDPAPQARGSHGPGVRLLCVAAVNSGKGHDVLLEALAAVPNREWHLTCAGSLTRDRAMADRVRGLVRQLALEDRVTLAGELDAETLVTCYDAADVFVLATRRETYGMAVAEALARGLPVVSTTTGAIPELVGPDAGVLVPPGEVGALTEALSRVIGDAELRARLATGAREVRDRLQVWEVAAARMDAALQRPNAHVETLGDWLKLREATDWEARSSRLVQQVVDALAADRPLRVLDLATGTGSNVRYLADRLPAHQQWLVVDRSPDLLALVTERTASWAAARGYECHAHPTGLHVRHETLDCEIETRQRDLRVLDDIGLFEGRHLVTASALLDLVSESWLRSLAAQCRDAGAAVLFALTYNGESSCSPPEPEDELIRELLNRHQHTDKGLGGVAAGPDAVACAERCFIDVGYQVHIEPTDWNLGPARADMQRYLIRDWAGAAGELAPDLLPRITSWRDRRLTHIDAGRSRIIVRHHDLAAWPAKP